MDRLFPNANPARACRPSYERCGFRRDQFVRKLRQ
jgi:hypothetical protein